MTDRQIVINQKNTVANTPEIFYTNAGDRGAIISAFSATNDTESSKTYKAYIYTSEAPPSPIIPQTIVVRDRVDNGLAIINQIIPAGGTLRVESSDADSLNFNVSALEQT